MVLSIETRNTAMLAIQNTGQGDVSLAVIDVRSISASEAQASLSEVGFEVRIVYMMAVIFNDEQKAEGYIV